MPEFIRLPDCVINLSQIRMVEFEGGVVVVHWANHDNHLVLRGDNAAALLDGLERRTGVLSDLSTLYWIDKAPDHCDETHDLDNIFTSVS